jgi:glycosyltransferase EpsE
MPFISVLLPIYGSDPSQLLSSIASVMLSDFCDLELIVGLDGPAEDKLLNVLDAVSRSSKTPIRVLTLPRQGLVGTLNSLVDASDSAYVARQDADDFSLPLRFARQVEALQSDQESGFCGTQICRCDSELKPRFRQRRYPTTLRGQLAYAALLNNPIAHPSLMVRRSALEGLRYRDVPGAEDWQLFVDLWQRGVRSFNLTSVELLYRTHPAQVTAKQRDGAILKRLQSESLAAARRFGLATGLALPHWFSQSFKLSERLLALRGRSRRQKLEHKR